MIENRLKENSIQKKKEPAFEIWLGNLRKYTEGNLEGEWIRFPQEEPYLQEVVRRIAGPDNDEMMIFDIDTREDCRYMRDLIGEWSHVDELNTIARLIGDAPHPAVEAYLQEHSGLTFTELANLFMQESEIPYYPYKFDGSDNPEVMERLSNEAKMGWTVIEEREGLVDMLKGIPLGTTNVMDYLDVEAVGQGLSLSGYCTLAEDGYYNVQQEGPDLSAYTMDEIKAELADREQKQQEKISGKENEKDYKKPERSPFMSPSL